MTLLKAPLLPKTTDREVEYRDKAIRELYGMLMGNPFIEGRMIKGENGETTGVDFTSGTPKLLDHGLGRAVQGFIEVQIAGRDGDVPVLEPAYTSTVDLTKQLRVRPNNTARCWVWVY